MHEPASVPVVEGLIDLSNGVALHAAVCPSCNSAYMPPVTHCRNPECAGAHTEERSVGRRGVLLSWTRQIYQPPAPFRMDNWAPHLIGLVVTEEGMQVLGMLTDADESNLQYEMPVSITAVPLYTNDDGSTIVTYAYKPVAVAA